MHVYLNSIELPTTLALAIMAILGYVFGTLRERGKTCGNEALLRLQRDLSRAEKAVKELGETVCAIRSSATRHYSRLKKFQRRIARLADRRGDSVWQELCQEVESLLGPTFQLASEIANAQEGIRYQSNYLMTFSEMRTDPLTGLGNRRALDYVLNMQYDILKRFGTPFCLAVVDIDNFKALNDQHGHQHGDRMLRDLADLLLHTMRTVDILARYGGDELVIVMPHTDIQGAAVLGERLREEIERRMPFTVSIGLASAADGDAPERLFKRADAALYRAKTNGRNRISCNHDETGDARFRAAGPELQNQQSCDPGIVPSSTAPPQFAASFIDGGIPSVGKPD